MDKINEFALKIQILNLAKKRLKSENSHYVCHAIRDSTAYSIDHDKIDIAKAKSDLLRYISKELENHYTLGIWIKDNRPDFQLNALTEYRIQWIDWMIEQYEDQIAEESKD